MGMLAPDGKLREIGRGDDRQHAFQRGRARGVDAGDARVRVRAAQQLGVHRARQRQVGRIDRLAGDALAGIDARQPLADDLELAALGVGAIVYCPRMAAAAAAMASTILP